MLLSSRPKSKQIVEVVSVSVSVFVLVLVSALASDGVSLAFQVCENADACKVSRSGLAAIIYDQHLIEIVNNNGSLSVGLMRALGKATGQGSLELVW